MSKTILRPAGVWNSDPFAFSQGVKVTCGTIVFIAGQSSQDKSGEVIGDNIEAQITQTFENMRRVLQEAGATFDSVVKLNAYFTDMADLPKYENIASGYFPNGFPAQTVVEVRRLARPRLKIEVEAVAVL